MKSTIRTLFLLSALLFSACEKDDSIFTELSIRFVMPDSRPVEKLEIRTDISYFDNINSGERVPFPAAEQNSAEMCIRDRQYGSAKGFTRSSSKPTRPIRPEKRRFCAARITIRFQQQ